MFPPRIPFLSLNMKMQQGAELTVAQWTNVCVYTQKKTPCLKLAEIG